MAMIPQIINEKCNSCQICVQLCPAKALKGKIPQLDEKLCIQCGHCFSFCPQEAFFYSNDKENQEKHNQDDGWMQLLKMKRSCRIYTDDIPSNEILHDLALAANYSSTASNSRNWKCLFYFQPSVKSISKKICKSMVSQLNWIDNPLAAALLKNSSLKRYTRPNYVKPFKAKLKRGFEDNFDPIFFDAPVIALFLYPKGDRGLGLTNTALAAANMQIYAETLGLGTCHIGFAQRAFGNKALRKQWNIPLGYKVGQVLTLGYPRLKAKRTPPREIQIKSINNGLLAELE